MNGTLGTLGPRDLGEILGETYKIYRDYFPTLVAIVAIIEVIPFIASIVLGVSMGPEGMGEVGAGSLNQLLMPVIILLYTFVGFPLMSGALIHAVSEQYLLKTMDFKRAYSFSSERLGAMAGALILVVLVCASIVIISSIAAAISPVIGVIFMLAAGLTVIYLGIRWIFIWQAAALDGRGAAASLSRSANLVEGNWWRVLGIMLVLGIISTAIQFLSLLIPVVGIIIGGILATPIYIVGITLLYYDLRVRKEEFALESLAGEIKVNMETGPPTTL